MKLSEVMLKTSEMNEIKWSDVEDKWSYVEDKWSDVEDKSIEWR